MLHLLYKEAIECGLLRIQHLIPSNLLRRLHVCLALEVLHHRPEELDVPRVLPLVLKRWKKVLVRLRNARKVLVRNLSAAVRDLDCAIVHSVRV